MNARHRVSQVADPVRKIYDTFTHDYGIHINTRRQEWNSRGSAKWRGTAYFYRSARLHTRRTIIIKKWSQLSQAASLYLALTNIFNFCILKNHTYSRVSTLCIDSKKDVDTRRAHVRYYVTDPIDLQNGNATRTNCRLYEKGTRGRKIVTNKNF